MKKYWYRYYEYECVLCGCGSVYKERVYDEPKPKDWFKRHILRQEACGEHFV